jgi:predicted dehydrogenase
VEKVGGTCSVKAALIGCGLIGRKRVEAFSENIALAGVLDLDLDLARKFGTEFSAPSFESEDQIFSDSSIEAVFISTRHSSLAQLSEKALRSGKNVFVEKPGALNYSELVQVVKLAEKMGLRVHVGYNHRFHPAIQKAFEIFNSGLIGSPMFIRGRYGHGGRLGYEKEWRANPKLSGGGELIDQGTHLLDLSIGFLGELHLEYGATPTYYWGMPVEDNAFISVSNSNSNIAFLQASCTEWKNTFSFEVYCQKGKLDISGLGRSYGLETLTLHEMLPEMGPPKSTTWTFPGEDLSWKIEVDEFVDDLRTNTGKSNNTKEALTVLRIIQDVYARSSNDHN